MKKISLLMIFIFVILIASSSAKVIEVHSNSAVIEWNCNGAKRYDIYLMNNSSYQLYDQILVGNITGYEVRFVEYYSDEWHNAYWHEQKIYVPENASKIRYMLGGLEENKEYKVKVLGDGKVCLEDEFKTLMSAESVKRNPTAVYLSIGTIAGIMLLLLYLVSRFDEKSSRKAYLYILPAIMGLALLTIYPVIYGFYLSFTDYRMGRDFSANFVGLENYAKIFSTNDFYLVFNTTVIWTVCNISLHILLGLTLALILNRKIKGRKIYRTILLLPWAIPAYISVLVWRGMFDANYGIVNYMLGVHINWLGEMPYAFIAALIVNVWLGFPFMMMIFLGGLQSIPKELYEAAEIDGFTRWQKFRYITLPMLKPVATPAILLGFIWTFNMFNVIYLLTGGGPQAAGEFSAGQTDLLITFVYNRAFRDWMFGYAAAYSVVIFLIILSFSVAYNKFAQGGSVYEVRKEKINVGKFLPTILLLYSILYILTFFGYVGIPVDKIPSLILGVVFLVGAFLSTKRYSECRIAIIFMLIADLIFSVYSWLQTNIKAYGFYKFNLLAFLDVFLIVYLNGERAKEYFSGKLCRADIFDKIYDKIKAENYQYPLILFLAGVLFSILFASTMGIFVILISLLYILYLFYPKEILIDCASAALVSTSLFYLLYEHNLVYILPLIVYLPAIFLGERAFIHYSEKLVTYGYLAAMLFFVILPVWWIFWISVNPYNTLYVSSYTPLPENATLEHYIYAVTQTPFLSWLRNSLIVAGGTTLLGIILAVTAAYGYSRFNFKAKKPTMMLFLVVQMFPGVIVLIPYYLIMYNLGLIDTFLGLIIAYAVTAIPLIVWMSKGFFDSIPKEIDEAAMVDGCSRFSAFLRVVLPLASPGIAVAALFSFITAWNEFVLAYTFMSEEHYTLAVGIMQFIGLTGTTSSQWGVFAAVSLLVSIPVVIVFLSLQKYLISGMTAGSVKG